LANLVGDLTRAGVLVMLSNSNTERIRDFYSWYQVQVVKATRSISCDGNRDKAEEVSVTNYVPGLCQVIELKKGVVWV
jgi:DNA adenine methylase